MKPYLLILVSTAMLISGCATAPKHVTMMPQVSREPAQATGSLFPSDQAIISDEAVERILSSQVSLPAEPRVALMRFPDAHGYGYWRTEQQSKLLESQVNTLTQALKGSGQVAEVTPLPSLMTPTRISIPVLREAAVRMQADLLLVYRLGSDTYSQYRTFAKDRVKVYCTSEMVLLDVRTGLVPFARVIGRESTEVKGPSDLDLNEAARRAEQSAAEDSLRACAQALVEFMKTIPRGTHK